MNSKGMTIVELIVTFALLLVIVVGLYNVILEVKFNIDDKRIAKSLTEYSAVMNNDIHYNLLRDKPFAIAIKDRPISAWTCTASASGDCEMSGNTVNVKSGSFTGSYNISTVCKDIYPCAIYFYVSNSAIKQKVIALNNDNKEHTIKDLRVKGILYGDAGSPLYEPIPDSEYVEIKDINLIDPDTNENVATENRPYIRVRSNIIVINYALYVIEDDHNYGFKIAYPFT